MKWINFFIIFIIINSLQNTALAQNDSVVAATELHRMNTTFGYRIKMNITKEGRIESLPHQEIQLSLSELKQISTATRKDLRFYIVRFVVAHEFAHQIQYYRYENDLKFMNNDLISKTLIETQADIMAGLIFFQLSPELFQYMSSNPQFVNDLLNEIFITTYNMGISENTLGSHPSKRDRMLAVRLGLTNGLSFVYDQLIKNDTTRALQNGISYKIFKKQMEEQHRFIDLKKDEDMVSWSYRQAKKIINYDKNISTCIILLTPWNERFIWHEEISNPYVDYKLTYKNISDRSIDLDMEVFVAHVNRIDSNSPENYRKVNVDHFKFTLPPGQSKTLEGNLLWLKNKNDISGDFHLLEYSMPIIVFPGSSSDDGIYSCSYSHDFTNNVYQENINILHFQNSQESSSFRAFFKAIVNNSRLGSENVIMGIGEVNSRNKDEIIYVSSIQYEDETHTQITIDNKRKVSTIEVSFPNFYPDTNRLLSKYAEIKKQLSLELEDNVIEEGVINNNSWVTYTNTAHNSYLQLIKDDEAKQYLIKFFIFFN